MQIHKPFGWFGMAMFEEAMKLSWCFYSDSDFFPGGTCTITVLEMIAFGYNLDGLQKVM